jgi:hypothetical protein
MAKIIRPTYPLEFSIGLLLLIFIMSAFVSFEIFNATWRLVMEGQGPVFGMALSGIAVVIMALILWEEFLFPVRIKPVEKEIVFRNHFTKLKTQVFIYCLIPAIVIFVYVNYDVSSIPFFIWAVICLAAPLVGKLISGIKNYNDFLRLTDRSIDYRNNEKAGVLPVNEIQRIMLIKDDANVLHKIAVLMLNNKREVIDLDEMELEPYLQTIEDFIKGHYPALVN